MSEDAVIADTIKDVAEQSGKLFDDVASRVSKTYGDLHDRTRFVVKNTTDSDGAIASEITASRPGDGDQGALFDHGHAADPPAPHSRVGDILSGSERPGDPLPEQAHQIALGGDASTGDLTTAPGEAMFWSGRSEIGMDDPLPWPGARDEIVDGHRYIVAGPENARALAADRGKVLLETLVDDRGIDVPAWRPGHPEIDEQWATVSARYAEGASGDIDVILGDSLKPGNDWENVEIPRLTAADSKVTSITKIDLLTLERTPIWRRGAP